MEELNKPISMFYFNEEDSNWELRRGEVSFKKKLLLFNQGKQELDLHYYLLRNSKKKDRQSVALESIEKQQKP